MTLNETIYRRKTTRKFDLTPLGDEVVTDISNFIRTVKPLYRDIEIHYDYAGNEDVKTRVIDIIAPHYLVISSENKDGYLTNVGFIFQQVDIYLQSIGLGSCWCGSAKLSAGMDTELEFVIAIAFGKPEAGKSPYRELSDFRRKELRKISNIADDKLEPARLAPSSGNSQPWYFLSEDGTFHVYCVNLGVAKIKPFKKMFEKWNKIDIGIALAHLYIAHPDTFEFFINPAVGSLKGYYYVGSIEEQSV